MTDPAGLASSVLAQLDGARVADDAVGRLGTRIQRLVLAGGAHAYLKTAPHNGPEDLVLEHDRLCWLHGRLPVPEVLGFRVTRDSQQLLISVLPGVPAHQLVGAERDRVPAILADALRRIQAVELAGCPFRGTTEDELAAAEALLARGALDEPAFTAATGLSPATAIEELHMAPAPPRDLVWTHGDFCLPNVLIDHDRLTGIIDWGLARIGDPARDLTLLEDSLRYNFGDAAVPAFYAAWGPPPPRDRVRYLYLLDQLSTYVRGELAATREELPP